MINYIFKCRAKRLVLPKLVINYLVLPKYWKKT